MISSVLCVHCENLFSFTIPEPPADAPPPLPSDRIQLSLTCTHCKKPMSLRLRTADVVQALAEAPES